MFPFLEFPAFQQHIAESEICPIVVTLAKNDSEAYVRASALSCLCPMVSIQMFWESCLSSMDLTVANAFKLQQFL